MPTLLLLALLSAAPADNHRVLVLPLGTGDGVTATLSASITDAVASEARRHQGLSVLTSRDVTSLLTAERQKQLLGCTEGSCLAELGGALGAERIISGSVAKLGTSWLLPPQLLDATKAAVMAQSDRRKKGG